MGDHRDTPAERVAHAVRQWGPDRVVRVAGETLATDPAEVVSGEPLELITLLRTDIVSGIAERSETRDWLAGGKPPGHRYWARVWACRAFLYVWDDSAGPAVVAALDDDHWRVRELAGKVIARREVPDAADRLAELAAGDPVPRVRAAACRALSVVGEGEHLPVLAAAADTSDRLVAAAAEQALDRIRRRLDRDP
ncbi:HEAT repeat domain-containing protein [Microlunatus sp. GCM10028923]|uniref:HEAT repeat domain-containing protein n=1 Tax=Microlunatus sp. GCM10028923 TaxID=3273400 RepID=UPI003617F2CF